MLMSHFEEPKLSDDEEPPTEQDKRKKLVSQTHAHSEDVILQSLKAFFSRCYLLILDFKMAPIM